MKLLLTVLALIAQPALAVGLFTCEGGPYELEIAVRSEYQVILNGFDRGEVDWEYARYHPNSKTYRLIGTFDSIGGGTVSVSKGLFGKSRTAKLYRVRRGGNGVIVSDTYRCQR